MKWDKNTFMADMREKCSREIAKIGNSICEFSEKHAADILGVEVMITVL